MLFFQVMLLAGYAYSHLLIARASDRTQRRLHAVILLVAIAQAIGLSLWWGSPVTPTAAFKPIGSNTPVLHILVLLAATVGVPYFALSTTGPLLQAWFGRTAGNATYRWYALSNAASLLGLLTYPILFEPYSTLRTQGKIWTLLLALFAVACLWVTWNRPAASSSECAPADRPEKISLKDKLLWFALAACASTMLLATTNQITQEVAVIPLLWVVPLALYLLSFVICFDHPRWYSRPAFTILFGVTTAAVIYCLIVSSTDAWLGIIGQIVAYLACMFAVCMLCHGELARSKPSANALTAFYLLLAAGGAFGGIFVALIAPLLFGGYWELHVAIWACWALLGIVLLRDPKSWLHRRNPLLRNLIFIPPLVGAAIAWRPELPLLVHKERFMVAAGVVLLIVAVGLSIWLAASRRRSLAVVHLAVFLIVLDGLLSLMVRRDTENTIVLSRNFYGALAVWDEDVHQPLFMHRILRHGRTTHGYQFADATKRRLPTSYYGPTSGIGLALRFHPRRIPSFLQSQQEIRVGVVGLGIGTLAAYGLPGDYFRFYELNPEVERIALSQFTYLKNSSARIDVALGDARLSMEHEVARGNPQQFDVMVLDAFNSDSVPVHLLTREAFGLYLKELRDRDGIIAVHVSNRALDLRPVVQGAATSLGLALAWIDQEDDMSADGGLTYGSSWILLSRNLQVFRTPEIQQATWVFNAPHVRLWTDDYSNLWQVIKKQER
jgi:hypothetical protein